MNKNNLSTNSVVPIAYPHAKEWSWTCISHHTQRLTQWIKILKIRAKTIKQKKKKKHKFL